MIKEKFKSSHSKYMRTKVRMVVDFALETKKTRRVEQTK